MKILIVGEAWGEAEARARAPFVGPSGRFLRQHLQLAGFPGRWIDDLWTPDDAAFTNCFNLQPRPTNDIKNLCGPRSDALPGYPSIAPSKYLSKSLAPEIDRLFSEIRAYNPNLILSLGNTPLTILTRATAKISKNRGNIKITPNLTRPDGSFIKILPTYHPANVLRDMGNRPVMLRDFMKALRHCQFPEFVRPSRELWLAPSIDDIRQFIAEHILPAKHLPWGVDIETAAGTITEIGFARPSIGIVIPFLSRAAADGNYWQTARDEVLAWRLVAEILNTLTCPVFQNGLYDLNYLWRTVGITPRHAGEDTMLLAHSQQPELRKGLGFLGSIYTDEPSWKFMRRKHTQTLKREDE